MRLRLQAVGLTQSAGGETAAPPLFRVDREWEGASLNVIMGESGVGKSTLLKSLGGVMRPLRGRVLIEGRELWTGAHDRQDQELLRRIGFSFQNNALFSSMSSLENLCFPHRRRRPETDERARLGLAREWLEKVGLRDAERQLPHELSGGMQKRLAIARTLMLEPDYLFFDDPTAGLDPITSRQIAEMLGGLLDRRKALTFIVTNDEDRARAWSPRVFELEGGDLRIKEHAT